MEEKHDLSLSTANLVPMEVDSSTDDEAIGCCQAPRGCRGRTDRTVGVLSALWHLITGIERAMVIPTLWMYLESLEKGSAQRWYGLVLGIFGLSVFLSAPLLGFLASQGVRVKLILIFCNFLEIIGNIIYLLAKSPLECFLGRLVAGLGVGCESSLYSDLVRTTKTTERTHYVIGLALGKELGIIIGPILTLIFAKVDVPLSYGYRLNVYNAPGLLLAILWILHTFMLVWYPITSANGKLVNMKETGCREFFIDQSVRHTRLRNDRTHCCGNMRVYGSYVIVVMLFTIFAANFNAMCLEAFLPALATTHYGWTELEISYTYIGVFVILLLSTAIFFLVTRNLDDRVSLLSAFIIMGMAYIVMIVAMMILKFSDQKLPVIVISLMAVGIHSASMPGVITLPESVYSKLAPIEDVERAQTISRLMSNFSFFIGLYLGGTLSYFPTVLCTVMAILSFLPIILILLKYENFKTDCFSNFEVTAGSSE